MTREDNRHKIELSTIVNRDTKESKPVYITDNDEPELYYLRAEIRKDKVTFFYSTDGVEFLQVGEPQEMRNISDEHVAGNGFTGSMLGVNYVDVQGDGCIAQYKYLEYEEL